MSKKISYMAPVEEMSGKFGNANTPLVYGYGGFIGRPSPYFNGRKFFAFKNKGRTSAYSASELAYQQKFKQASQQAAADIKDPQKIPSITAAFKAQKKYKTLFTFQFAEVYRTM